MNKEKARLLEMLQEKKITEDDYHLLLSALRKRAFFSKISSSMLLNPFQKIAGGRALIIGIMIMLSMAYIGVTGKTYFLSPLSIVNASALAPQTKAINFLLLAYQNGVAWLVLVAFFMGSTHLLQKRKIRLVDFLGTVALALFPSLLVTIFVCIVRIMNPSFLEIDLTQGLPIHASMNEMVFGLVISSLMIWQLITYFYALKESSGMVGRKLCLSFIVSMVLSIFIAQPLTTIFMN